MFGIDGPEFLVILIVLIVVVGPKDLPKLLRAFGKATARMRATANEFRKQFDEAMHEAELDDLQKTVSNLQELDPRKKLTQIFDPIRDVAKDVRNSIDIARSEEQPDQAKAEPELSVVRMIKQDVNLDKKDATSIRFDQSNVLVPTTETQGDRSSLVTENKSSTAVAKNPAVNADKLKTKAPIKGRSRKKTVGKAVQERLSSKQYSKPISLQKPKPAKTGSETKIKGSEKTINKTTAKRKRNENAPPV